MATLISQPNTLCFSSDIADIVFGSNAVRGELVLDIYCNGNRQQVLRETMYADNSGSITISDISSLAEAYAQNMTWSFTSGQIRYVVNMKFRDGRYKVTVENFRHESMDLKFPKTKSAGLLYKAVNEAEIDGWTKGPFEKKSFRRLYKEVYKRAMPLCEAEAKKIFEGLKSFSETKKEEDDW